MSESLLCVGIGNDFRRDDGAGLAVARRLLLRLPTLAVVELSGDASPLLDLFEEYPAVVIVDASQSGAEPGTIHHFDVRREPIPAEMFTISTHSFGPAQAVALAETLGKLPSLCHVYGIEGADFSMGEGLTPAVEEAVESVTAQILAQALALRAGS